MKIEVETIYEDHIKSSSFVALVSFAFGGLLAVDGVIGDLIAISDKELSNIVKLCLLSVAVCVYSFQYYTKSKKDLKILYFRDQLNDYLKKDRN